MSDKMFAEPLAQIGGKQKYTVLLSIVAHTVAIATAIVVPLVATNTIVLPTRLAMVAFPSPPPAPPSLPPPRGAVTPQAPIVESSIPVVAPDTITAPSAIPATSEPFAGIEYRAGLVEGGDYAAPPPPAPAPAAPRAAVPVGGDIRPPAKIQDAAPVYPAIARAARVQGVVIIEATIGPNGRVQNARVIRSIPLLDAAALDAVRQWVYTPTLLNGEPVAVVMTVTLHFRLQ